MVTVVEVNGKVCLNGDSALAHICYEKAVVTPWILLSLFKDSQITV